MLLNKLLLLAMACALPAWAQTNNAQYISDTIPATMIPGFTYNVAVTMKNTGTTTWSGNAGYFLWCTDGYNFDVYHNQANLGGTETIAPGQDRTFNMPFIAPSAATYTTGWRMVKDGVGAFGDTCMKQVVVAFGPSIPGAPTINSPTHGMTMGSNRPDVRFQGDPCDAYEVHIGSYNLPTSNNGWDSGVVWLNSGPNEIMAAPGVLNTQATYYVFARLHNTNGWGPWSAYGNSFYTDGQLVNDPYLVAGEIGAQRAHQMCYNPDRNEYLVGYFDSSKGKPSVVSYYRLDGTGTKIGSEVTVVDDLGGAGGPHMCYNSARKEYLIVYGGYSTIGGEHNELRVQRVDAATGALIGGSVRINTPTPAQHNIAYSPRSDRYLLAFEDGGQILGLMLDSTAAPVGTIFPISNGTYPYSGTPRICYNSTDDEFFVPWVVNTNYTWDAFAQRVRASDGALMGPNITIGNTSTTEFPGGVAYDSDMNRYLVICDGEPDSPWVQFVSASGTLIGPRIPVGGGYYHGGMSGIAWSPVTKEYLATWASCCTAHNFACRISQTGTCLGETFRTNGYIIGYGNWDPIPVANTTNGEFLIVWFWQYDNVHVRRYKSFPLPPVDTTPPGPVTNLNVTSGDGQLTLSWTNPSDGDFAGTMIRWKIGGYPSSVYDGMLLVDKPNVPGSTDNYTHSGLSGGTTYCYAAFAYDQVPLYSTAVTRNGTPGGDRVIFTFPFDSGADGWSTATWKTGSLDPGTIAWSSGVGSSGGGMRATGSGSTDNNTRETREGGEMWNTISTVGFDRIKVVYDLRASTLGTAYYGSGGGDTNAHPDHEDIQEQLTLSYRTSSGGSWTELSPWLGRDTLLGYQSYGTRTVDLAGLPGVDSCAGFGLKFRWQFNTTNDMGDLDNITVRGYRMENVNPTIGITGPTSDSKCPANTTPFAISGWASDNVAVTQVSWSNNRGGSGVCSGTAWWDASIPLLSGQNNITVVARDAAGNMATDSVLVTYVPGAPVSIAGAKSTANDINVYVAGKLVTAVFADCIYVEEEDRGSGIKVSPLVMPSGIEVGKRIDFGGSVKSATTGERYLYGPVLIVN